MRIGVGIISILVTWNLCVAAPFTPLQPCTRALVLLDRIPRDTYSEETVLQIFEILKSQGVKVNKVMLVGDDARVIRAIKKVTGLNLPGKTLYDAASHLGFNKLRKAAGLDPEEEDPGYSEKKLVRVLQRISKAGFPVNSRTLSAGFDVIKQIIFEETGLESDGEKLLSYLRNKVGLNRTLTSAGLDRKTELRAYLKKEDITPLLRKLDDLVSLDEQTMASGSPIIDKAVGEYTHSRLKTEELWLAIQEAYPEATKARALKLALVDAGLDPAKHGLGQTREAQAEEKAEQREDRFSAREKAAIAILVAMHTKHGCKMLRSDLLVHRKELKEEIRRHSDERWTPEQFFSWMYKEYPGGFTAIREKANVPVEQEARGARNFNGIEKEDIIAIFELMHANKIKVNRENLLHGSEEIDFIIETVLGYPVSSEIIYETSRRRFADDKGGRMQGFRNAQLAANLNPKIENYRSRYNRLPLTEDEILAGALRAIEGKRPLDYASIRSDESPETERLIFDATGARMTGKTLWGRVRAKPGGWYGFMENTAGIDAKRHRIPLKKWTPENRKAALHWLDYFGWPVNVKALSSGKGPYREIIKFATGEDLSPGGLLHESINNPIGGHRGSLKEAGLDFREIYETGNWSDADILKAMRLLYESAIPLNLTYMRDNPPKRVEALIESVVGKNFKGNKSGLALLSVAAKRFDGLDNALWMIDVNPREQRLRFYSYRIIRDRTLNNLLPPGTLASTRKYFENLVDIVENLTPGYKRLVGFLVLDTIVSEPLLKKNPEGISKRIYFESGKAIPARTIENFLSELATHSGYQEWSPH